MRERIDIMLDLETLSLKSDALIIQIAALPFDINTGEIYFEEKFDVSLDLRNEGRLSGIDGGTLLWWLNDDRRDLFYKLMSKEGLESDTLEGMLIRFKEWIINFQAEVGKESVYMWANGILFDCTKIQRQMENHGFEYPIHYQNDRDQRTIVELGIMNSKIDRHDIEEIILANFKIDGIEFTQHDAIDDCHFQIKVLMWCRNELIGQNIFI